MRNGIGGLARTFCAVGTGKIEVIEVSDEEGMEESSKTYGMFEF